MQIKRYEYNTKQISAIAIDQLTGFLWIAHKANSSGMCVLNKTFVYQPDQIFYTLERETSEIVRLVMDDIYIYALYKDGDIIVEKMLMTNPFTTTETLDKPIGITEEPVDFFYKEENIYILFPGSISNPARVIKYSDEFIYQTHIDILDGIDPIYNASSLTVDDNEDIWVITNTNPSLYIRIFETSPNVYDLTIHETV